MYLGHIISFCFGARFLFLLFSSNVILLKCRSHSISHPLLHRLILPVPNSSMTIGCWLGDLRLEMMVLLFFERSSSRVIIWLYAVFTRLVNVFIFILTIIFVLQNEGQDFRCTFGRHGCPVKAKLERTNKHDPLQGWIVLFRHEHLDHDALLAAHLAGIEERKQQKRESGASAYSSSSSSSSSNSSGGSRRASHPSTASSSKYETPPSDEAAAKRVRTSSSSSSSSSSSTPECVSPAAIKARIDEAAGDQAKVLFVRYQDGDGEIVERHLTRFRWDSSTCFKASYWPIRSTSHPYTHRLSKVLAIL